MGRLYEQGGGQGPAGQRINKQEELFMLYIITLLGPMDSPACL